MKTFEQFYSKFENYKFNEKKLKKAFDFAQNKMEGMYRFSGRPYIEHPLEVAESLLDFKPSEEMLIAALLHDVLKNPQVTLAEVEKNFGEKVTSIVKRLWDLRKVYLHYDSDLQIEKQIENLRNMFMVLAGDLEVVLVRLADRLHNMKTLDFVKPEKQRRIAFETMHIYAPIAARFGIYSFKNEFEDLSFKYLHPKEYEHITEQLDEYKQEREEHINYACNLVANLLKNEGIEATILGRMKSTYSIYSKMKRKNRNSLKEITDLFALRIILPDSSKNHLQALQLSMDCYKVLGLIHYAFVPVRNRFKDYIALPKPNGYRSLHTTVMGLSPLKKDIATEIQIRNQAMHREAEYGIAAHWQYVEMREGNFVNAANWVNKEFGKDFSVINSKKFTEESCFFRDSIYVLTPDGEALDLPTGSTPVDFAYNLKTDLGHRMCEAKVNGVLVAHNYELKNGDVVEIIVRQIESPSRNWLRFVKSVEARESITNWFGGGKKSKEYRIGLDVFNKELQKKNLPGLDEELGLISYYSRIGEGDSLRHREAILEAIGKGSLKAGEVLSEILEAKSKRNHRSLPLFKGDKKPNDLQILIGGEPNIAYRLAKCCNVGLNNEIIGYVTRGRGISIHCKSCSILKNMDPQRLLSASIKEKIN